MAMKIPLYDAETKKEQEERGGGFVDLEEGTYTFEIKDAEVRPRGTQNPQPCVMVSMKILEGPTSGPYTEWWTLPTGELSQGQLGFWKGFWFRTAQAVPGLFNEASQEFEPKMLRGFRVKGKGVREQFKKRDGTEDEAVRLRSVRVVPKATDATAAAAPAATPATPPDAKPQKFTTPS